VRHSVDKNGACTAPLTRQRIIAEAGKPGYADIMLFSHDKGHHCELRRR